MGAANVINKTYAPVLRTAGWHQTDTGLLWVPPSMTIISPRSDLGVTTKTTWREGVWVRSFELHNRSGGAAAVGIGGRMANRHWIGGRLSADGATFTDLTSSLQSTGTATVQVTGANQTGFCILSRQKFDWVSVNFTTAETDDDSGGEINHTVEYSTGATWTTLGANAATTDGFTKTGDVWGAAVADLVMFSPVDWEPTKSNGGVPDGYYGVRSTSAGREASDVAAVVTGVESGNMLVIEALADNGIWEMETVDFWMPYCESLVAYFSTANAGNRVYAEALTR